MRIKLNGTHQAFKKAVQAEKRLRKKIEEDMIKQISTAMRRFPEQMAAIVIEGKHAKKVLIGKIYPEAKGLIIKSPQDALRLNEGNNYELPATNVAQVLSNPTRLLRSNQKLYLHYQKREDRDNSLKWTIDDLLAKGRTSSDSPVYVRVYIGNNDFKKNFLMKMRYSKDIRQRILKLLA